MNADEIRRLLSEYAAGTISDADRHTLMKEAAENQSVFEAVYSEQPLAELMSDPEARAELRVALAEQQPRRVFAWRFRPFALAAVATVSVAFFAILVSRHVLLPEKPAARQTVETSAPEELAGRPAPQSEPSVQMQIRLPEARPKQGDKSAKTASADGPGTRDSRAAARLDLSKVVPEQADRKGQDSAKADNRLADERQNAPAEPPKEERLFRQSPGKTAESKAEPPAAAPRQDVVGGAAGGVVGGVVGGVIGGIAAPPARQERERDAMASAVQSARPAAGASAAKRSVEASVGLRYQLWKRLGDGTFSPVPPETVLNATDAVQVEILVPFAGYLQVSEQEPDGTQKPIFPVAGMRATELAAGSSIRIPSVGALEAVSTARDRRIVAVLTRQPIPGSLRGLEASLPPDALKLEILIRIRN